MRLVSWASLRPSRHVRCNCLTSAILGGRDRSAVDRSTVYVTVLDVCAPSLSVAVTVKVLEPAIAVSTDCPFGTGPEHEAIGLVIPPSLHAYEAVTLAFCA